MAGQRLLTVPDEPYDAGDPEHEKKAAATKRHLEDQRRAVVAGLLESKAGREWLFQIMTDCGTLDPHIAMSAAPYEQGFFNGQREVGLRIHRMLARANAEKFALMLQENDR